MDGMHFIYNCKTHRSLPPMPLPSSMHTREHPCPHTRCVTHTQDTNATDTHAYTHKYIVAILWRAFFKSRTSHSHPPTHSLFVWLDWVLVLLDAWAGFTRTLFSSQMYVQIVMAVCLIASDSLPKNLGLVWKGSLFGGGIFCKRDLAI